MLSFKKKQFDEKVEMSIKSIDKGHHNVTYKGVKCIKCPFDYVIYQMLISDLKPDLIIEIGSNYGGGALYLADLMELNGNGEVHTIDIEDKIDERVKVNNRIKFYFDGWEGYDISITKDFQKILVIDDASHKYSDTLGILKKFSPIISNNSYIIVEDGILNYLGLEKQYDGGPLKAIKEYLLQDNSLFIDRTLCDLFGKNATFNVNGYLKKNI